MSGLSHHMVGSEADGTPSPVLSTLLPKAGVQGGGVQWAFMS